MEEVNKDWPFTRDPGEFLFRKRVVSLPYEICPNASDMVKDAILTLDTISKEPITLYVDSCGGSVDHGLAIYDLMNFVESPVATVCCGVAASMAAIILAGGEEGMRYILPHSRVMIHQPIGQIGGNPDEIKIYQKEIEKRQDVLAEILTKHTGRVKKKILQDIKHDNWFNAEESVRYGLVDKVVSSYKDLP